MTFKEAAQRCAEEGWVMAKNRVGLFVVGPEMHIGVVKVLGMDKTFEGAVKKAIQTKEANNGLQN